MAINDNLVYTNLGKMLRKHRELLRLSQSDIAKASGMLRTSVSNIEAGRQKPPLHVLYVLCQILKVEVADVLPKLSSVTGVVIVDIANEWHRSKAPRTAEMLEQIVLGSNNR